MQSALFFAAFLAVALGAAHSYLGERYLLIRLFRRGNLPKILGSTELTVRTLRFAWHLTSVAWLGFAVILIQLAYPPVSASAVGLTVGCTFLVHFAVALIGSRGRHLSWLAFLAIGVLAIFAASR